MEKVLYAVDELTGLIWAAAKMRPSKSTKDMEVSSLKKKFKDKKFAAGCSRDVISKGAEVLEMCLEELFEKTILAMRSCEDIVEEELKEVYYSNVGDVSSSTFKYLFYDMNWLFFCGWMFLFCIVVVIAVSMFTAAPSAEKIQGLVFGTSTPEQKAATRASWNKWDIIHTLIILGITAAFYWYFW